MWWHFLIDFCGESSASSADGIPHSLFFWMEKVREHDEADNTVALEFRFLFF